MEGEAGAQVIAPAIFRHPGRFQDAAPGPLMGKKRDPPWQAPRFPPAAAPVQTPPRSSGNWDPKDWGWDSAGFTARPSPAVSTCAMGVEDGGESLTLKLGVVPYEAPRPSKRVRAGSPGSGGGGGGGGGAYPMCQVDDCKADLSGAKDYHRRHKVCEAHSKMAKAVVGKVMQRFCQQCSRFHPLSEFDEGKRSCRRRLAGHNRRRRKTQPEDVSSRLALPGSQETGANGGMDIVNLLSILARLQGKNVDKQASLPPLPDKDHILQILNTLQPLQAANSSRSPVSSGFDLNVSPAAQQGSFELPSKTNGNLHDTSRVDLVAALSAVLPASQPRNNHPSPPQASSHSSGDDVTFLTSVNPTAGDNLHDKSNQILPSLGVPRISCLNQYMSNEPSVHEARVRLPLQLFGSSEDDSPPKLGSSVKYMSSESSNPMEDGHETLPVHTSAERRYAMMSNRREENQTAEASTSCGWSTPLDLFKRAERPVGLIPNRGSQAGYASSSGSDRSPSSSTSDAQDRTGRISFKLFDKDPSNLPPGLRSQILNWLSSSPSDMESYIRPGCVVLSIYVSMPAIAWDELEQDLPQRVRSLLDSADSDFWRNGRFLCRTSKQLASHKDGKIRLCKSWRTWSAPELTSVSPVAVVCGKETSIVLKGRNLTVPGTKIHCAYMGGYTSKEVLGSTYPGTIYDHCSMESFNFPGGTPNVFGRCFIEVENGFKGNNFPVIIADSSICRELRGLEAEFEEDLKHNDVITDDQIHENGRPRSREDIVHFLNELGWLFQNNSTPSSPSALKFSSIRFKFLFAFSVERDWSSLIKTLLDILAERSIGSDALSQEALEMLQELQLLSRAVKRKCRKMVDLLLRYSVKRSPDSPKVYLFPPNLAGPGALTPLHLAASTQDSEDIVDALTDDPQEIGLHSWDSIKDDNDETPFSYASMRNNHSYNRLVSRKLADRINRQLSITVGNEDLPSDQLQITEATERPLTRPLQVGSCAQCAMITAGRGRRVPRTRGLLHRPYVHSMLAIAAVCVCVCLFLRGMPKIGSVAPFKWENLDYGPR